MKVFFVLLTLFIFSQTQVVDQPGNRIFIRPEYNFTIANSSTSILNQGRYDAIEFFKIGTYDYYSFFTSSEYSLFIGPTQPIPGSLLNNLCTLGLTAINITTNPPAIKEQWEKGTLCSAYFCNNDTGINNYFLNIVNFIPANLRSTYIVYHYSIINMCMLCKNTENQIDFINMVNTNKSQCGLTNPRQQISFCQTNKCGDDPSKSLCVYTQMRSVCYNWAQRRFYWAMDSMHEFFTFYVFYGNVLTLLIFIPLTILTIIFIIIPTVFTTILEVKSLRNQIIIDSVCWTYTRKIFSLYNQACFNLLIAEGIVILLSVIDFGSWYKLYPISLFVNFFFTMLCFINLTGMLVYGTDTQRSMQGLPLAGKYVVMLIISYTILFSITGIGILLFILSSFVGSNIDYVLSAWYLGIILVFFIVGITLFAVLGFLFTKTLVDAKESKIKLVKDFLALPYMKVTIILNFLFVGIEIIMLLNAIQVLISNADTVKLNVILVLIYIAVFLTLNIVTNIGLFSFHSFKATYTCKTQRGGYE